MKKFIVLVLILLLVFCCEDTTSNYFSGDEIKLEEFDSSRVFEADGNSEITVSAKISPFADDAFKNVQFSISSGSFIGTSEANEKIISRKVNSQGVAYSNVKLPRTPGKIYITASIGDKQQYYDELVLELRPKYPDTLIIENDKNVLVFNEELDITTYLVSYKGQPSTNLFVSFDAYQLDPSQKPKSVGKFLKQREAFSGLNNSVNVKYVLDSLNNGKDTSRIYIRSTIKKDNGTEVNSIISLPVKKK